MTSLVLDPPKVYWGDYLRQFLLKGGEQVIKEGPANVWRGIEAVGGKLYLTDKGRLVHVPHRLNIQQSIVEVQVSNTIVVKTGCMRFLGIPISKNGLFVKLSPDREFKYVVWGKESWQESIKQCVEVMRTSSNK